MTFNHNAIPTIALAEVLFVAGVVAKEKARLEPVRIALVVLGVAAAVPCILVLVDYTHFFNSPRWFYEFRTAAYSELTISGMGFMIGYLYALIEPERSGEKIIWPIALFIVVSLPFVKPVLDPIDLNSLRTTCPDNVCLQTTYSTCGPSSAASILLSLGQDASEQSLAREALTSKGGTELWYLARALQRRGFSTNYVIGPSAPELFPTPAVAGVLLIGGTGHFIALISRRGDQITLIDPLKGRFNLSDTELRARYHFSGVFLVISRKL